MVIEGEFFEGEVEAVTPLYKTQDGKVFWWAVKLKGTPGVFALHRNWIGLYGGLKPGDQVRYIVSKAKLGNNGTQGVSREGHLLFDELRKVEKEKPIDERRAERWKKSR